MPSRMTRREFIKLAGATLSTAALAHASTDGTSIQRADRNVLVLVFDALSAENVSLYGYRRHTTPNLERLAERSNVYFSHQSAGNFTTPGTGSILSGTYPWTHRGLQLSSRLGDFFTDANIFSLFKQAGYTTVAYTQNAHVNPFFDQFRQSIDHYLPAAEGALIDFNLADDFLFNDYGVAGRAEERYLREELDYSNSLFFSILHWIFIRKLWAGNLVKESAQEFPRGVPNHSFVFYPLARTVRWLSDLLIALPQPYFAYIHLMPPHDPYHPSREFIDLFEDDFVPGPKPRLRFDQFSSENELNRFRRRYDQFVAYADHHLGALLTNLESRGVLDRTWLIFTSDHGEMFERGIRAHTTQTLYEPITHIPLLISGPGQSSRVDVHSNTSAVDLVPTLMHLAGQNIPAWSEGMVLPGYSESSDVLERSVFSVEAKSNPNKKPLTQATISLRKGNWKLIYYTGYPRYDGVYELYDLDEDPEELVDLSAKRRKAALGLRDELLAKLERANQPYT